jgi:hypothetical protein
MLLLEFSFVPPGIDHLKILFERNKEAPPLIPSLLPMISSDTGECRNDRTKERRYEKADEAFT